MTATELQTLERRVLDWIAQETDPISTTQLLDKHRVDEPALTGESLRRAVWNLVDRGRIAYDYEWRLTVAHRGGR